MNIELLITITPVSKVYKRSLQMDAFRRYSLSDQKTEDNGIEEKYDFIELIDELCDDIIHFGEVTQHVSNEQAWHAIYDFTSENQNIYMGIVGTKEREYFLLQVVMKLMDEASLRRKLTIIEFVKEFSYHCGSKSLRTILLEYLRATDNECFESLLRMLRKDVEIADHLFGEPEEKVFNYDSDDCSDEEIGSNESDEEINIAAIAEFDEFDELAEFDEFDV